MSALLALADDIAADRRITAEEALRARKEIFPDGVVSRQEADVLIALESRVDESDEAWAQAFVEALVDHVLGAGPYPGHVDEPTVAWLKGHFADAPPRRIELEALVRIAERAESAPASLQDFVRERIAAAVSGRPMDAPMVEFVRRCVYAGTAVTDAEIRWLFALDAECDGRDNDPAWRDLFVKAALCHVAGRRSPAALEAELMLAREARFAADRPAVTPISVIRDIIKGGFSGFGARVREAGWVDGMEDRYEAINAEAEEDAKLTAMEMASMLGMVDLDGKRTANETALIEELRKLEAEQAQ